MTSSSNYASTDVDLARRLEQSISLAPAPVSDEVEAVNCGPFRAWFSLYTQDHQANYAMPVTPTGPAELAAAVETLHAVFTARSRTLRVEFVEELWPGLAAALQRCGLHLEAREPLMACMNSEFASADVPGVSVRGLSLDDSDADLATFTLIRDEHPLDGTRSASERGIAALRERLRSSPDLCAIASIDGRPAAVGRCIPQDDGLGEITSIVTLPEFRRRGAAGTLVSFLLRELFAGGRSIGWLNAANEQARSVYTRLGFRSIGNLLNYEE